MLQTLLQFIQFLGNNRKGLKLNIIFFNKFQLEHAKKYKNPTEERFRKKVYLENKRKVNKHNQLYELGHVSFKLGLNKYSDLQDNEFVATMCGSRYNNSSK